MSPPFKNMTKYLIFLIFAIFAVPVSGIYSIPGTDVWYVQYIGLLTCFFIGLSLLLWRFNKYISIFSLVCLFSTVFVANQHPRSVLCLIQVYLSFLAMYGISKFNTRQKNIILWSVICLTVVQGIYTIVQYFNLDPFLRSLVNPNEDVTIGFSGSWNQIALFFAVVSPLITAKCFILLPLVIFGMLNAHTSFAWVAFIVSNLVCLSLLMSAILPARIAVPSSIVAPPPDRFSLSAVQPARISAPSRIAAPPPDRFPP